jgi:hypothetical protein
VVSENIPHEIDSENRCTICGAHIAEPHNPDCPHGDATDFEGSGLTFQEVHQLIVDARINEVNRMRLVVQQVVDDMTIDHPHNVVEQLITYMGERWTELRGGNNFRSD